MNTRNTSISVAQYLRSRLRAGAVGLTLASVCVATMPANAQDDTSKSQPAPKQSASKQENIGVATGLAVGAVAGGPIGAIVGAAAGAWLGDRYHKQAVANSSLKTDLAESKERTAKLEEALKLTDELQTDVKFRTNEASVDTQAMSPLLKLGAIVASMPDVKVRVAGYADPRGSDGLNDALSKHRAEAVAAVLENAGVSKDQMIIEGHGKSEATSQNGDMDGYAFDRRVTVKLEHAGTEQKVAKVD